MARKYNLDGSYTVRNSEGATRIFPDGKEFYMNVAGQKALQEYYKSNNFNRVQTGTTSRRVKEYTGAPKAGGQGWQYKTVTTPTYGYLPSKPFVAPAPKPKPAAKPKAVAKPSPEQVALNKQTESILKIADSILANANKPTEPAKMLFSAPMAVGGDSLKIAPAAPPAKNGGVDPFKRKKQSVSAKIVPQTALKI